MSVLLGDGNMLLPPADATETSSAVVQEAKSPESLESGDIAGKIYTVCAEIVFDFVFVSSSLIIFIRYLTEGMADLPF